MTTDPLGRYEILHELGRGAMGVVYKARDPLIDRTVAIKTINLDASMGDIEGFERRFYREAKSAGRLNHRNIVTIYDVGRSGDSAYIAMEFLEGRSLREIIDSGVVLPSEQVADIAGQIADGLACAHENGVVHRDIKPANLIVLDNGTVKITDFGIAMLSRGSRTLGSVFGSPKYISPEQVIGQQPDGRSDIFSLGAVLYELLTGAPAFTASDLDAVLCQVINEMPPPPSARNKSIARAFDRIVARAMAKHPNDRYATARDMLQELRNFRDLEMPPELKTSNRTLERRSKRRAASEKAVRRGAGGVVPAIAGAAPQTAKAPANAARWGRRDTIFLGVSITLLTVAAAWAVAPKPVQKQGRPPVTAAAMVPPAMAPARPDPPTTAVATQDETPAPRSAPVPGTAPATAPATASAAVPIPASTSAVSVSSPPAPIRASRLAFAVSPWGEVYVDGRRRGISPPLQEVRLAPGKHVVEIRNTNFQRHSQTVDIEADSSVRIKHKFQ